jgi:hypothetical protein
MLIIVIPAMTGCQRTLALILFLIKAVSTMGATCLEKSTTTVWCARLDKLCRDKLCHHLDSTLAAAPFHFAEGPHAMHRTRYIYNTIGMCALSKGAQPFTKRSFAQNVPS